MRKNIFICIIFAVSISACTEELDKEINIETNSSLYDLSESEALTIAKTFHESVTSEPRTRDNNTAFGIKSTYRLHASEKTRALSSEKLPLIYEIEINNGPKNHYLLLRLYGPIPIEESSRTADGIAASSARKPFAE